jgi:hypothetical protein
MRHNSVGNIDSEVVGSIAGAALRHEGEVPGAIVGRSRVCGTRQGNKEACCRCVKRKLFHVISPKRTDGFWVRHGNGEAIDPLKENIFSHRINTARGRRGAPAATPLFLAIVHSGGKQRCAFGH